MMMATEKVVTPSGVSGNGPFNYVGKLKWDPSITNPMFVDLVDLLRCHQCKKLSYNVHNLSKCDHVICLECKNGIVSRKCPICKVTATEIKKDLSYESLVRDIRMLNQQYLKISFADKNSKSTPKTRPETEVKESQVQEPKTKESNSKGPQRKETQVQEPKVQEPQRKEPVFKAPRVRAKDSKVKEPTVKDPELKEPEIKDPEVKEPEVKEPEVEEPEIIIPRIKESRTKEPRVKGSPMRETISRRLKAKESSVEEPISKRSRAKEPSVEEPVTKRARAKESPVKEPKSKRTKPTESPVKEPKSKGSKVKESPVREPNPKRSKAKEPSVEEPISKRGKAKESPAKEPKESGLRMQELSPEEPRPKRSKAKESPAKETSSKRPRVKESALEEASSKRSRVKEASVEEPKSKGSKVRESPVKELRPKRTKVTESPASKLKESPVKDSDISFDDDASSCKSPSKSKGKKLIASTLLSEDQKKILDKFNKTLGVKVTSEFPKTVTHLVTKSDANKRAIRSLKYMKALLTNKWIVSFDWIIQSLEAGDLVPEEPFEITGTTKQPKTQLGGPARSRTTKDKLFADLIFYFDGKFKAPDLPRLDDLRDLATSGGGTIINFRRLNTSLKKNEKVIIVKDEIKEEDKTSGNGKVIDTTEFLNVLTAFNIDSLIN